MALPPCPKTIPAGRWRKMRLACLEALGEPTPLEVEMVEQMVRNLIAANKALTAALAEPMIPNSQGQVANPQFAVAKNTESQARAAADALLFTRKAKQAGKPKPTADPFEALDELAERRAKRG